jgi:hypothetical protein
VQSRVLEPCRVAASLSMQDASGELHIDVSCLKVNLSGDVLELLLGLQSSVIEPLILPAADRPLTRCTSVCLSRPASIHLVFHTAFRLVSSALPSASVYKMLPAGARASRRSGRTAAAAPRAAPCAAR